MLDTLLLASSAVLILYGIFKWITINHDYFKSRGIAALEPKFLVGNTIGLFLSRERLDEFLTGIYNKFPNEKIIGLFEFRKPFFFIRDPEVIKQLTVKDFDHFEDHLLFLNDEVDQLFGNSLIMLRGQKWRDMRATLSPAFTGSKMRQMIDLITDCATEMTTFLRNSAVGGKRINWEMKNLFAALGNDVIASAAFGIKVNSFENPKNEFALVGKRSLQFGSMKSMLKLLLIKLAPWAMKLLNMEFLDKQSKAFFRSMVLENMQTREKNNIFRPDMINIMMQVKKGNLQNDEQPPISDDKSNPPADTDGFSVTEESSVGRANVKRKWADDELVAQCLLFFVAGFDTTSNHLSFFTYELALNPAIQTKLYDEVAELHASLNGKPLHYDALPKLKYMDMAISEVLRKWAPVAFTDRLCVKDYVYDDGEKKIKIAKKQSFWIPIYALHHDPKYFPNPKVFDPERFSDERKGEIVPGTYLPFGVGPRNCIGSRFALMQLKSVMYHLLLNFEIVPNEHTQIPLVIIKSPVSIGGEKGIHLEFKPRHSVIT